ncbi:MAG: hypothetical protein H7X94_02065 [Vallitaleaceae bacterium]|nr:hypothetical protein [Vallitaleaceae bacterium]
MNKRVLIFILALLAEVLVVLMIINVSYDEAIIDKLFVFGSGILLVGLLLNFRIFAYMIPQRANKRNQIPEVKEEAVTKVPLTKTKIVNLNILVLGILLIIIDYCAYKWDVINNMIQFKI